MKSSQRKSTIKSCSIFFYDGWLGAAPTVINVADLLSKNGYQVTIFTRDIEKIGYRYIKPIDLNSNIKVIYFRPLKVDFLVKLLSKMGLGSLVPTVSLTLFSLQILNYRLKTSSTQLEHSISIGIDTDGATLALLEAYLKKSKLVYLSLELNDANNFNRLDKLRLIADRLAFKKSSCVIIQDKDRFINLCAYGNYRHSKVFYIPNSLSLGNSEKISLSFKSSNFFRELFNLEEKRSPYLVVAAGMINDFVFAKELADAFNSINKKFALIFHVSRKRDLNEPYIKALKEINSNSLFLSLNPLPYEQIDRVFTSITIGLACYRGIDENYSNIAKASGKLAGYLMHGKPVLMSDLQSLSELNAKYQFGIVIKDPSSPSEIEQALETIIANYGLYSNNAILCYKEEFDFNSKSSEFFNFIDV